MYGLPYKPSDVTSTLELSVRLRIECYFTKLDSVYDKSIALVTQKFVLINCDTKTSESPRQSIIILRERDHTFYLLNFWSQSEHSIKTCIVKTIGKDTRWVVQSYIRSHEKFHQIDGLYNTSFDRVLGLTPKLKQMKSMATLSRNNNTLSGRLGRLRVAIY